MSKGLAKRPEGVYLLHLNVSNSNSVQQKERIRSSSICPLLFTKPRPTLLLIQKGRCARGLLSKQNQNKEKIKILRPPRCVHRRLGGITIRKRLTSNWSEADKEERDSVCFSFTPIEDPYRRSDNSTTTAVQGNPRPLSFQSAGNLLLLLLCDWMNRLYMSQLWMNLLWNQPCISFSIFNFNLRIGPFLFVHEAKPTGRISHSGLISYPYLPISSAHSMMEFPTRKNRRGLCVWWKGDHALCRPSNEVR